MPELPEVETIVRTYRRRLVGRTITAFQSSWPKQLSPGLATIRRRMIGRRIERLSRRAKYIVMTLAPPADAIGESRTAFLTIHLRMSGRFEWAAEGDPKVRHVRAVWRLDDGHRLLFCDARKFGRIQFAWDLNEITGGLGPEPLARSFTAARLAGLLSRRKRQLKPLLLDQSVIAGLGNIYTDEALFDAGLHPLQTADRLTGKQIERLHDSIRKTLRKGIARNGASIDWVYPGGTMQESFRVYGRTGEPCPVCAAPIEYLKVAQRGTHICPRCQSASDPRL